MRTNLSAREQVTECTWEYDEDDGYYATECKHGWYFETGTLKENNVKFCPFCGGRIR